MWASGPLAVAALQTMQTVLRRRRDLPAERRTAVLLHARLAESWWTMTVYPAAQWSEDCQGKWDYDGPLLSISCRYWPASWSRNGQCSAVASIVLDHHSDQNEFDHPDTALWRERHFYGQTEDEVKRKVETWVDQQFRQVRTLLYQDGRASRWRAWLNRLWEDYLR